MTQFQENTLIGQTKGWKDGQTLFYRAPPAPVGGGPINTLINYLSKWSCALMDKTKD